MLRRSVRIANSKTVEPDVADLLRRSARNTLEGEESIVPEVQNDCPVYVYILMGLISSLLSIAPIAIATLHLRGSNSTAFV